MSLGDVVTIVDRTMSGLSFNGFNDEGGNIEKREKRKKLFKNEKRVRITESSLSSPCRFHDKLTGLTSSKPLTSITQSTLESPQMDESIELKPEEETFGEKEMEDEKNETKCEMNKEEDSCNSSSDEEGDEEGDDEIAIKALSEYLSETENMLRVLGNQLGGFCEEGGEIIKAQVSNGRCCLLKDIPNKELLPSMLKQAETHMSPSDFSRLDTIVKTLKPYQTIGIQWLHCLHSADRSGILADEMGLGKTAQTCVFLSLMYGSKALEGQTTIISAPASLLDNWMTELNRWAPSLKVAKYHGKQSDRRTLALEILKASGVDGEASSDAEDMYDDDNTHDDNLIKDKIGSRSRRSYDVIVTSPQTLTNKWDSQYIKRLRPLAYLCVDEAHQLKNKDALVYRKLNRVCKCNRRILLTGSPVQNNPAELRNLLLFVMPAIFDEEKLELALQGFSLQGGVNGEIAEIELLQKMLAPFILRRLKDEVLQDLPPKHSYVVRCQLSPSQKRMYQEELDRKDKETTAKFVRSKLCRLRRICNHPLLFRDRHSEEKIEEMVEYFYKNVEGFRGNQKNKVREEILTWSDFEIQDQCRGIKALSWTQIPPEAFLEGVKIREMLKLIRELKTNGRKGLVFTQYTTFLDVIEESIRLQAPNIEFVRLDGNTPIASRQDIVDSFGSSKTLTVFLLSTKAGGQGLNLSAANTVILMDQDWNPHNDRQAEDRVHRLGQTKEVYIHRLCCRGTIEESILRCCRKKLDLDEAFGGNADRLQAAILEDSMTLSMED